MCDGYMGVAISFKDSLLYMLAGIPTIAIIFWV